jgi:hypothetical protein
LSSPSSVESPTERFWTACSRCCCASFHHVVCVCVLEVKNFKCNFESLYVSICLSIDQSMLSSVAALLPGL